MPGCSSPPVTSASRRNALPARRVVGVLVEDLLERDFAVQLRVERHEDGPQAAAGMRPKDAESQAVGRGGADGVAGGSVAVVACLGGGRPRASERRLDVGIAEARQTLSRGTSGRDRGQALLRCRRHASSGAAPPSPRYRRSCSALKSPRASRCWARFGSDHATRRGKRSGAGPDRSGRSGERSSRRAGHGQRWTCGETPKMRSRRSANGL